jgi:hypothetical protein
LQKKFCYFAIEVFSQFPFFSGPPLFDLHGSIRPPFLIRVDPFAGVGAGQECGEGQQEIAALSLDRQLPAAPSPWTQPVRLAGGRWLILICSERKVLLAGCWWLICSEGKVLLAVG